LLRESETIGFVRLRHLIIIRICSKKISSSSGEKKNEIAVPCLLAIASAFLYRRDGGTGRDSDKLTMIASRKIGQKERDFFLKNKKEKRLLYWLVLLLQVLWRSFRKRGCIFLTDNANEIHG
jgi:hypothetical protein